MKIKLINARSFIERRQLFMLMRMLIFLMCTTVFSLNSKNAFAQKKVTIHHDQLATVDQVFKMIKKQTDYRFIYPKNLFKKTPKVQLKKGEIEVGELLKQSLSNNNLNFELTTKNTIVIKEKTFAEVIDQGYSIKGIVVDTNGQPLPGKRH